MAQVIPRMGVLARCTLSPSAVDIIGMWLTRSICTGCDTTKAIIVRGRANTPSKGSFTIAR